MAKKLTEEERETKVKHIQDLEAENSALASDLSLIKQEADAEEKNEKLIADLSNAVAAEEGGD